MVCCGSACSRPEPDSVCDLSCFITGYIVTLDTDFIRVIASRWIQQPRVELGLSSKQYDERGTLAVLNLWNLYFHDHSVL